MSEESKEGTRVDQIGTLQISTTGYTVHGEANGCGWTLCGVHLFSSANRKTLGFNRGGGVSPTDGPCEECREVVRTRYPEAPVSGLGADELRPAAA